jgi:hypothetical protein
MDMMLLYGLCISEEEDAMMVMLMLKPIRELDGQLLANQMMQFGSKLTDSTRD